MERDADLLLEYANEGNMRLLKEMLRQHPDLVNETDEVRVQWVKGGVACVYTRAP